jgi:hypothetical protein
MAEPQWVTVYAICDECKLSAEVRVRDGGAENIFPEIAPTFGRHPHRFIECPSLKAAFLAAASIR